MAKRERTSEEERDRQLRHSLGGLTMVAINMADLDILKLLKEEIDYLIEAKIKLGKPAKEKEH